MTKINKNRFITLFLFITVGINTFYALARFLAQKSEQPVLFGLSVQRLLLALGILLISTILWFFLYQIHTKTGWLFRQTQKRLILPVHLNRSLFWLLFIGYILFLAVTLPAYRMGEWQGYWTMLQPIITFLFYSNLILCTTLYIYFTEWEQKEFSNQNPRSPFQTIHFILIGIMVLCVGLILLLFKSDLIKDQYYWNVAAVPVLPQYVYLFFGFVFFLPAYLRVYQKKIPTSLNTFVLMLIIFITTNAVIQNLDIARNFFVEIRPGPPVQYYPYSDALTYDMAGKVFINGFGIGFWLSPDKPLFNAYVGLLYFFMGENYQDVIKLNVFLLALIPVMLFLIGKALDSTQIGLLFASVGILFEITTFQSSGYIANIHWKLLMSEPWGQLLVLVAAMGTIRWLADSHQKKWLYLTGIALGLGTYIRPQIVVLSVAFILILLINPGKKFSQRLLAVGHGLASFILFVAPWAIYCQIHYGYMPLISKFNWILNYRFLLSSSIQNSLSHVKNAAILPVIAEPSSITVQLEKIYLILAHFLNNIIKALLSLPTSLQMDSIPRIFDGIKFWDETATWRGEVNPIFFLSLLVFCIGLVSLYRKSKLMGLVPLIYMLFYFAALSMSRTSGSRYLTPVIWVVYLYYFFGIILIARYLGALIFKTQPVENKISQIISPTFVTKEKFAAFYFTIPLILGLMLPILDSSIPKNLSLALDDSQMEERLAQSIVHEQANLKSSQWALLLQKGEIQYGYGELVYPEIKALENDPTQSTFRYNLVGSHPLVDLQFIINNLSAEEISAIDLEQPYFVLTCKQKNNNVYIPFIMQTKDQQHLYTSKNNLGICRKLWLPLLNP